LRRRRSGYLFIAPALILLVLFVVWPIGRAFLWGFQDVRLFTPGSGGCTGLGHYADVEQDPRFRAAFANTALFVLMVVPVQTVLAFLLALWVNRPERCWRWLRVVFFVPVVVAMPVLAVLWTMLYQPARGGQMGLVNAILTSVGLPAQSWLGDPSLALPAIAFMSVWQGVGLQMMIFLSGLQHLSVFQIEAAKIDGAGAVARTWHVIIPAMKNYIIFSVVVTTILAFRLFVQPFLMTGGGPRDRTLSVIQWIYQTSIRDGDLGLACAGAVVFLIVVAAVVVLPRLLERREAE
jgi:ABC-type sugar transport system permease subunit